MGFVCVYIYINFLFIKNGLSKINKRLATEKTQQYKEGRRKCPIESSDSPIVPPFRCRSIYTQIRIACFKPTNIRRKKIQKETEKKKEEKPLIARFSAGSQFLNFFFLPFLYITIWFDCLSLAWDGGGWPYDLHWIASFSLPLCRNIGWHFLLERENAQRSLMTKDGQGFFNCNMFFFFFNIPKKQSNGVVAIMYRFFKLSYLSSPS